MDATQIEQKRDKLDRWLKIGACALVALVVAPVIMMIVKGIVGLAVAAALGVTLVTVAPWFTLKMANLRYRLVDAEKVAHIKKVAEAASENPIETLTALLASKNQAFDEFRKNVEVAISARATFKSKVQKFAEKYPARASEFNTQYERMSDLVERKKLALQEAKKSLEDGAMKLEEMKAYWSMSQDAIALNKAAGMDTGDAFERLKADTACDAVFDSMNTAFAQLEIAAALDVTEAPTPG